MSAVSTGIGNAMGTGGKGGFGGDQPQGPQMGFGFNPNTDMPFGGQQPIDGIASSYNPAADLNKGLYPAPQPANSQGQMMPGPTMGMAGGTIQGTPPAGGFVNPFSSGGKGGFAEAPMAFGTSMGGGKSMLPPSFGQFQPGGTPPMFIDGNGNPTNDHGGGRVNMNINQFNPAYTPPQGPQIGFGFNPNTGGLGDMDKLIKSGLVTTAPWGPGTIHDPQSRGPQIGFGPAPIEQNPMQPAPQPVNRFAPPNAPGVRTQPIVGSQGSSWGYTNPDGTTGMGNNFKPVQQPRTAPRAGIPVQSARTVQPNRFTRSRTR